MLFLKKLACTSLKIDHNKIETSPHVKDLGAFLDSNLKMEHHVNKICSSAYYHIRNIAKIRTHLDQDTLKTLIHALVTSRIDFHNALLINIPDKLLSKLQKVQNASVRLLCKVNKQDHITPYLKALHWLPVVYRVNYKILLLTYKALHGMAPQYIQELLTPYSTTRTLRSTSKEYLAIPKTRLKQTNRAFSCAAPVLWNSLPEEIQQLPTLHAFKKQLKTHLFKMAFDC